MIKGNAFARIIRGENGRIKHYEPINPDLVSMATYDKDNLYYKVYDVNTKSHIDLNSYEILHLKLLSKDGIFGMSPLQWLYHQVKIHQKAVMTIDNFYENNAMSPMVLKPVVNVAQTKQIKEALAAWKEEMGPGYLNAGNTMVLPFGYDMTPVTVNFQEAQFIETQKMTKTDIATIYGVPAHLVGVGDLVKYTNNFSQMMLDFKVNTLSTIIDQIEGELIEKLLYDDEILADKAFRFNTDKLIELDIDSRMKVHRAMLDMGAKTIDEIRNEEEYESFATEFTDKPLIATSLMSLDKAFVQTPSKAERKATN
ncbi:MAG: phage portal protein [Chloroflexia bacterium]|nr:phage portal protein [Chloroflexia bacterium]